MGGASKGICTDDSEGNNLRMEASRDQWHWSAVTHLQFRLARLLLEAPFELALRRFRENRPATGQLYLPFSRQPPVMHPIGWLRPLRKLL